MIREKVIVTILTISRIGQRVYFQIKLPKDTKRIIGVECGVMGLNTVVNITTAAFLAQSNIYFRVVESYPIGRLTLIAPGTANIFFQTDIMDNSGYHLYHEVTALVWSPTPWSHFGKTEEYGFDVNGDIPIVEGSFIDGRPADDFDGFKFNLHIYLWVEKHVP